MEGAVALLDGDHDGTRELAPSLMPATFAVPGGSSWQRLEEELAALPGVIGFEVKGCARGHAPRVADTLARL